MNPRQENLVELRVHHFQSHLGSMGGARYGVRVSDIDGDGASVSGDFILVEIIRGDANGCGRGSSTRGDRKERALAI